MCFYHKFRGGRINVTDMADKLLGRSTVVMYKNLGRISYRDGLAAMKQVTEQHWKSLESRSPAPNTLIICEHSPVYTTGIRDKSVKNIEHLEKLGAEFQYTDRGGLITFHGPGQLMCYPILNLRDFTKNVRCYNEMLEEVGIRTCKKFGVVAKRTGNPGVWVDDCKIAAIG
jgi:lipoyl(octanoyl) transferase